MSNWSVWWRTLFCKNAHCNNNNTATRLFRVFFTVFIFNSSARGLNKLDTLTQLTWGMCCIVSCGMKAAATPGRLSQLDGPLRNRPGEDPGFGRRRALGPTTSFEAPCRESLRLGQAQWNENEIAPGVLGSCCNTCWSLKWERVHLLWNPTTQSARGLWSPS